MNYAPHLHTQVPPDYRSMSDAQLLLEIDRLTADTQVIVEQLKADQEDGHPAPSDWRRRAQVARAHKAAHLKLAEAEHARRNAAANRTRSDEHIARLEAERRASEARRAERAAHHEASQAEMVRMREEKALRRAEAEAEWQRRQTTRAGMFMAASERCMSKDERERIWAKAEEMFPGAIEWERRP